MGGRRPIERRLQVRDHRVVGRIVRPLLADRRHLPGPQLADHLLPDVRMLTTSCAAIVSSARSPFFLSASWHDTQYSSTRRRRWGWRGNRGDRRAGMGLLCLEREDKPGAGQNPSHTGRDRLAGASQHMARIIRHLNPHTVSRLPLARARGDVAGFAGAAGGGASGAGVRGGAGDAAFARDRPPSLCGLRRSQAHPWEPDGSQPLVQPTRTAANGRPPISTTCSTAASA